MKGTTVYFYNKLSEKKDSGVCVCEPQLGVDLEFYVVVSLDGILLTMPVSKLTMKD